MRKITKLLAPLLTLSLLLTGCVQDQGKQMVRYRRDKVVDGIYVFKDDIYYGLYQFGDRTSPSAPFQWEAGEDALIPELEPGSELVLFTTGVVPEEITLYSMDDFGYTAGIKFSQYLTSKNFTISKDDQYENYCPTSVNLPYLNQTLTSKENIRVMSISDDTTKYDLTNNMLNKYGLLKGLTKDAVYTLYFYQGTEYHEVKIKADTRAFILNKAYTVKNYLELEDKHFSIKLPKNMSPGFWMIEAGNFSGMFYLLPDVELFGEELIEKEAQNVEEMNEGPSQEELLQEIDEGLDVEIEQNEETQSVQDTSEVPEENTQTDNPEETPEG